MEFNHNNYVVKILIVDDDINFVNTVKRALENYGFICDYVTNGEDVIFKLKEEKGNYEVILLDYLLPDINGIELMKKIKQLLPETEIIIITAHGNIELAVNAIKQGAYDFITKPLPSIDTLILRIEKAIEKYKLVSQTKELERKLTEKERYGEIIGISEPIKKLKDIIETVALTDTTVLIEGESGTGKELVARTIHLKSKRRNKPFICVNCGAIPENLVESELFGYKKGAFTGAVEDKQGIFMYAEGGTIFFDEIGELPLHVQVKLLRVLQEKELRRIGDLNSIKVDVRIIAATNKDLKEAIKTGKFREDLFYRLNVVTIKIPPLRERKEDIPVLTQYILKKISNRLDKKITNIEPEVFKLLTNYDWPGNVRELENIIERVVVFAKEATISLREFEPLVQDIIKRENNDPLLSLPFKKAKKKVVTNFEHNYILGVMKLYNYNVTKAAQHAGMDPSNFRKILKKYRNP